MVARGEGNSGWCFAHKKHETKKQREEFFIKNGAQLLEESIASFEGGSKPVRIFLAKELEDATDNYAKDRILRKIGNYTHYKGAHEDRTIIVKKYDRESRPSEEFEFEGENPMKEAVILSHVEHRNVVKFIGCCIETEIPIIVCEFLSNGTLEDHIDEVDPSSRMSWENRLRIATEIAYGLAYLHIATSRPIVHMNIRSRKILLDECYTPKIADFGLSILIPLGKTYLRTDEIGVGETTFDVYMDPQWFFTNRVTEKSDVFSFGVILIELLTAKRATERIDLDFLSDLNDLDDLNDQVLKVWVLEKGKETQLVACIELAKRCIRFKGEERPTMKEVVEELKKIKRF